MKTRLLGWFITLLLSLGQFAQAAVNADSNLTPVPTNISPEIPHNPFSGGENAAAKATSTTTTTTTTTMLSPAPVPLTFPLTLNSGELLSQGIKKWADSLGYKLLWQSKNDYLIYSHIILAGKDDDEVLTELGKLFLWCLFYCRNHGIGQIHNIEEPDGVVTNQSLWQ